MKYNRHVHSGFTLTEILISLGIFLIIFTVMLQNFFLLQRTMYRVEIERNMTMFTSSALQTIASDIDEYRIDIDASSRAASTLVLTDNRDANLRITYSFDQDTNGNTTLTRRDSVGNTQKYNHNIFSIDKGFFMVRPHSSDRTPCSTHPSVTVGMTVSYISSTPGENDITMPIQTTFSSPESAYSYLNTCP